MEARRAGADHVELLRRWVLAVLVLGLVGTVTELMLLEHYEQPLQLVPLVLIVAAVAAIAWQWRRNDAASLRALAIIMVLFVLAGGAGMVALEDRMHEGAVDRAAVLGLELGQFLAPLGERRRAGAGPHHGVERQPGNEIGMALSKQRGAKRPR